jgi:hypothetical protein
MGKRQTALDAAREITQENARPGDLDGLDNDGFPIKERDVNMATYKIRLSGTGPDGVVLTIEAGPHAWRSARVNAKFLANSYRDRTVLVYQSTTNGYRGWKGWRWNETRRQVQQATVGKAEWDANNLAWGSK